MMHLVAPPPSVVFIVILLFSVSSVSSQKCEPFGLDAVDTLVCIGRVPYNVFVPAGFTQKGFYEPIFKVAVSKR